ncbi:unnamed protein product, partial [Brassica oleracea var. botrytis]
MAVNPLRPNEFFFKPKDYRKSFQDVEEKLSQMKLDRTNDRLKVAIMYFLATVIDEKSKYG